MFFLRLNSPQRLNRLLEIHCHQKNRRSFFGRKSATPIPQLIPKHIYSSQDVIPSEITSSDYTVVSDYESDGWPIYQRLPPERVLEKYFATKGLVKNSIFVVGPGMIIFHYLSPYSILFSGFSWYFFVFILICVACHLQRLL